MFKYTGKLPTSTNTRVFTPTSHLTWCDNIGMDEANVAAEIIHVNMALGRCEYPKWSFRSVIESMDKKKQEGGARKKEDRGVWQGQQHHCAHSLCQGGFWSPEPGVLSSWYSDDYVTPHVHQEYASTHQGQEEPTRECRGDILGPLQGLPVCVHCWDRKEVWCEGKWTWHGCKIIRGRRTQTRKCTLQQSHIMSSETTTRYNGREWNSSVETVTPQGEAYGRPWW